MEETHYRAKRMRPLGKRRVAALAAVLVLLLGIAAAGVQYFDFVFQTVYEESTAHLAEVLHQSNNMLNEVVEKNLTYLHMWETTMCTFPTRTRSGSSSSLFSRRRAFPTFISSPPRATI